MSMGVGVELASWIGGYLNDQPSLCIADNMYGAANGGVWLHIHAAQQIRCLRRTWAALFNTNSAKLTEHDTIKTIQLSVTKMES